LVEDKNGATTLQVDYGLMLVQLNKSGMVMKSVCCKIHTLTTNFSFRKLFYYGFYTHTIPRSDSHKHLHQALSRFK